MRSCDPIRVWILIELELLFKNLRVACHETIRLMQKYRVLEEEWVSDRNLDKK